MIQPITGSNPYAVSQVQPIAPRPMQSPEVQPQVREQQPLQDAAIFRPSEPMRDTPAAGYGPDAASRNTAPSDNTQTMTAAPEKTPPPATAAPAERAQNLYQQPENIIREFTRPPEQAMQGQQLDIVV